MSTERGGDQPGDSNDGQLSTASHVPRRKKYLRYYLKTIGPSLTVIALLLSIFQLYQATKAERESNKRAEEARVTTQELATQYQKIAVQYEVLSKSVPTRYVGVFPQNMNDIIELVENTQYSLTVITDVAAYGHFSSPSNSDKYISLLRALSAADRKINIRFLSYNSDQTKIHLSSQFGDFNELKKTAQFQEYKDWHKTEPADMKDLVTQIDDAGRVLLDYLNDHKATVKRTLGNNELPIFMWISDDKEAIFSMHNYGQSPREDSFRTTDRNFIDRLKQIAEEDFSKSAPY